jgi:MFS family permease
MSSRILLINAAHLLTHYSLLILPTAVLAMAVPGGPFGADYGPVIALATGGFVLYGLMSLPQGWLAARFGSARMILVFFAGLGASLALCALATGPAALAAALALAGGFAAIYHPIGQTMLVEAAGDRPGRVLGLNGVCGNFGVSLAPVVTAALAGTLGWRAAFLVPGALCAGLGVIWGLLWARMPETAASGPRAGARPFPPIPAAFVRRAVVSLLLIAAVSGLVFNAFTVLIPKLLADRLASSPALVPAVGLAAFLVTLCGALAQFSVGRLIDRTTLRRVFLPISAVLAPALLLCAFARGWAALPVAAITAAALFGQITVNETMAARYIAPERRAHMYSLRFFVAFLGSAGAAPIVGLLQARTGSLAPVLILLAACSAVTLGCAVLFPDRPEELRPELWGAVPAE